MTSYPQKLLYLLFILFAIVTLRFVPSSLAQDPTPEYTVRVFFFYPNDYQPLPDVDEALDTSLKKVQQFYADEMERHGFGRKTFRLETDENGKLRVHHFRGRFATEHYHDSPTSWPTYQVNSELDETIDGGPGTFDLIYVAMNSPFFTYDPHRLGVTGIAGGNSVQGRALVFTWNFANLNDYSADRTWKVAAHELGHSFGLEHDFRNDHYIMSYGPASLRKELSECAAKWLNVHRCFNPLQTTYHYLHNDIKIHMLRPIAAPPPSMMKLRFRINHSEHLYQAMLLGHPIDQVLPDLTLLDCKFLNGNTDLIEFDVNELGTRSDRFIDVEGSDRFIVDLVLMVIDVHGNFNLEKFIVNINDGLLSDSASDDDTLVSIPDPNLASVLREELALLPGDDILRSEMMQLTELNALYQEITDITGLEHASNLTILRLTDNRIADLTPIAELYQLEQLSLAGTGINDISPLTGLTKLQVLYLLDNQIRDVSPLVNLTNLKHLYLSGNPIKDRKPLLTLLRKNPDIKIYLKNDGEPLPVTLSHFRAEYTDAGVVLNWTTESEVDNAGFYIYRSLTQAGEFKVITHSIIQGAGTTGERNAYTWTDTTAKPNTVYYYQIEDVSHAGVRKRLASVRLRGLLSTNGKLITRWGDLKIQDKW